MVASPRSFLLLFPAKLIAESPHETDSGQKSTQLRDPVHSPAIPFRANLRFLFFRKSVQPPMIHALDRVNALEKQAVRIDLGGFLKQSLLPLNRIVVRYLPAVHIVIGVFRIEIKAHLP